MRNQPPPTRQKSVTTSFTVYPALVGAIETHTIPLPEAPGYERLKSIVCPFFNGDELERVRVIWNDTVTDMFVGEHSTLREPRNVTATAIYRANALGRAMVEDRMSKDPEEMPPICGTAIVFHRPVWF